MKGTKKKYVLDCSAIIYMALLQGKMSNVFRLSLTLKETVDPTALQEAVNNLTPRFPTVLAGIQDGAFQYFVVPVSEPPLVKEEEKPLIYMPRKEVKKCGTRILYKDNMVAVEFFHAITDGRGATYFLKALIAEYVRLKYGVETTEKDEIITPKTAVSDAETEDSFMSYAGKTKQAYFSSSSYRFKSKKRGDSISFITGTFDTDTIIKTAHKYGTTVTTFLSAVMLESIMDIQIRTKKPRQKSKPVHLMIPIDLRRQFPSVTLRNFALQAYLTLDPDDVEMPFENLMSSVEGQLRRQFAFEPLSAIITQTAHLQKGVQYLPLFIKSTTVRIVLNFVEENTSALFFSNLGLFTLPDSIKEYVTGADFALTPRNSSPYNCGVVSYGDKLRINLTKCGEGVGLERLFFEKLHKLGCIPELEVDGEAVSMPEFLGWR